MRHLRIDEVHCPFRELEEGEEIHWNARQTSLYEDQSTSVREKFAPPPSNPFNDFIQKRLDILSPQFIIVERDT